MKFKILVLTVAAILISVGIFRFSNVNKKMQVYAATEKKYKIGEEVKLEKDFFSNAAEIADGYSVTVLDTSYMPINEFKEKYEVNDSTLEFAEYVYLVRANFKNNGSKSSEKTGISIKRMMLQNTSFISYPDTSAFMLINDFDNAGFSLTSGSEREFILPFGINEDYINIDNLKNANTKLIITLFPNKKMINLNT